MKTKVAPHFGARLFLWVVFDWGEVRYTHPMSFQPPMVGKERVIVVGVQSASIHGDIYYDTAVVLEADAATATQAFVIRIAAHLCERQPAPRDVLELGFLMGQVNAVGFE